MTMKVAKRAAGKQKPDAGKETVPVAAEYFTSQLYGYSTSVILPTDYQMKIRADKAFNEREQLVVPAEEIREFILNCLKKYGCDEKHGQQLADILICADYRGHYSHGISRLHIYVEDVATKSCAVQGEPKILKKKGATAWVDGQNLLGPVVGNFCMQLAIDMAKDVGVGWVVVKNSNHFGTCGWYAQQALENGMVGLVFTNTSPCLFPTRSAEKCLGSNPICMAAPAKNGDSFLLDMATSTVAYGKVCLEIELADDGGVDRIPETWGNDSNGQVTNDPKTVLNGGGLQPLGGHESTGGYKGTGLCMMVEILCGIFAGSAFGKNIRRWRTTDENANLGHCFVAIDPECFAPGFADRLQQFLTETRDSKPLSEDEPVLTAGDFERAHMALCDRLGGMVYGKVQFEHLEKLGKRLNVPLVRAIKHSSIISETAVI